MCSTSTEPVRKMARLVDLPGEIRNDIYALVLASCAPTFCYRQRRRCAQGYLPPITRACRLLRAESRSIFFAQTRFVLLSTAGYAYFDDGRKLTLWMMRWKNEVAGISIMHLAGVDLWLGGYRLFLKIDSHSTLVLSGLSGSYSLLFDSRHLSGIIIPGIRWHLNRLQDDTGREEDDLQYRFKSWTGLNEMDRLIFEGRKESLNRLKLKASSKW